MFQLVTVLIAIGLMSAMLMATVSYVSPAAIQGQHETQRLERGLRALKTGYNDYVSEQKTPPGSLGDITPKYAFLPNAPGSTAWTFSSSPLGGQYFCLSGTFPPAAVRAILNVRAVMSPQAYFISASCGVVNNGALPGMNTSHWSGAVTLWVAPYDT